jgi:cyclase
MFRTLITLVCAGTLFISACGGRPGLGRTGLVKVTDHVYAFIAAGPELEEGLGANSGFIVGSRGVLVVDARQTPDLARELLEAIGTVTDAPVRYLVYTHYHPDHTWGGSVFDDEGAAVLACPGTGTHLEIYSPLYHEYYKRRPRQLNDQFRDVRVVLPDSTVDDGMTIDLGGVTVRLRCIGRAHTEGDCVVTVPEEHVAFMGGILSNDYHPNLGDQGGDVVNWLAVLEGIGGEDFRYFVPGQGRVCERDALEAQTGYIEYLRDRCREAIRSGLSLEKAVDEISVPGTSDYEQGNLLPFNIQACYRQEVLDVVSPPLELALPHGFMVTDGAGGPRAGWVRWSREADKGRQDIEVHWKPTFQRNVILQDIKDRVAQHLGMNPSVEMEALGSKRVSLGGVEATALYGGFRSGGEGLGSVTGDYMWVMHIEGGIFYQFRLSASGGKDGRANLSNLEELERQLAAVRFGAE